MKKIFCSTLIFISVLSKCNAQFTVTCTSCTFNYGFNPSSVFISTGLGWYSNQPTNGGYNFWIQYNSTTQNWQIRRSTSPMLNNIPDVVLYTGSPTIVSSLPPCNDTWKLIGFTGVWDSYSNIRFSSTTATPSCITLPVSDPTVGSTVTTSVFGVVYPAYTSFGLFLIPSPPIGLTVFDYSQGIIRTWNGTDWVPL